MSEEQGRPAGSHHTTVDLGHLEVRINRRVYRDEVVVRAQAVEERTEIWKRHSVNNSITNPQARPRPIRAVSASLAPAI